MTIDRRSPEPVEPGSTGAGASRTSHGGTAPESHGGTEPEVLRR
ncbi:MAG: hypothetical protein ACLFNC_05095 [Halodesulfurarchaeum sp.]